MTATDVLMTCRQAGIVLEARGDKLVVDAPVGALTPTLRDALAKQKPALLNILRPPVRFITLKNGPTLPADVVELGIDLECRGIHLKIDADHQLVMPQPDPKLTDADRAALLRWRHHLGALVQYRVPEVG